MASGRFKRILLVRFLAYFSILVGFATLLLEFGPVVVAEGTYRIDQILGVRYTVDTVIAPTPAPHVITSLGTEQALVTQASQGLREAANVDDKVISPVSTDYGIVIEKIKANARIIANVDPANEREYIQALSQGVAEAKGSTPPGQNGNLYVFSHSTDAPWNIIRLNAIFYLLRELDKGDRIIIFYQGKRFDYIVFDKQVVPGNDITFLLNRYDVPVLTLQTCDPPGTILNRMIIRAKLAGT